MNWAGFKYLVGHRFYPNHKWFKIHIYFLHETKSVWLHCIRLSFTEISVIIKVWRREWCWNELAKVSYYFPPGKLTSSLFIYLSKSHHGNKNSETTKARNLKLGTDDKSIHDLRHCNFGGATSRGLEQMHPKLVTVKFIKWLVACARELPWPNG